MAETKMSKEITNKIRKNLICNQCSHQMLEVKIVANCQQNKMKLAVMIWFSDYMIRSQEKNMLDLKFGTRFKIKLAMDTD